MNENQEKNMRAQVGELPQSELIDLIVQLQNTIETHVNEKSGFTSSIKSLGVQNEALMAENEKLEGNSEGLAVVDTKELDALRSRVKDLSELNEKLQRKLLG